MVTTFASILLADLAFLVFGWSKMSGFFYFHRFGAKRKTGVHKHKRSAIHIAETYGAQDGSNDRSGSVVHKNDTSMISEEDVDLSKFEHDDDVYSDKGGPKVSQASITHVGLIERHSAA